jgi:hypothetical protein
VCRQKKTGITHLSSFTFCFLRGIIRNLLELLAEFLRQTELLNDFFVLGNCFLLFAAQFFSTLLLFDVAIKFVLWKIKKNVLHVSSGNTGAILKGSSMNV